jgi:hypothetical protein
MYRLDVPDVSNNVPGVSKVGDGVRIEPCD